MQGTTLLLSYGRRNDLNLFSVVCGKEAGMKLRLFCCTAPANQRSEPSYGFTERFGEFFPFGQLRCLREFRFLSRGDE
jgi:hypothetical protein